MTGPTSRKIRRNRYLLFRGLFSGRAAKGATVHCWDGGFQFGVLQGWSVCSPLSASSGSAPFQATAGTI